MKQLEKYKYSGLDTAYWSAWQKHSFINIKWAEINFQAKVNKWMLNNRWISSGFHLCDFCQISKQIFTITVRRFSVVTSLCMNVFHKQTWPNAHTNSWWALLEPHWTLVYLIWLLNCTSSRASNQAHASQNNGIAEFTLQMSQFTSRGHMSLLFFSIRKIIKKNKKQKNKTEIKKKTPTTTKQTNKQTKTWIVIPSRTTRKIPEHLEGCSPVGTSPINVYCFG